MKRALLFSCVISLAVAGCSKKQVEGPFANPIYFSHARKFYEECTKDEKLADAKYKGKAVGVDVMDFAWQYEFSMDREWPLRDSRGRYISGMDQIDGKRVEVCRCYLADGPNTTSPSGDGCGVTGIYAGISKGLIILERCRIGCFGGDW